MKKLFFFRSSSNSGNHNSVSPPSTEKQVYWDSPVESGVHHQAGEKCENILHSPSGLFSKSRKQISDSQSCNSNSRVRRCRSLSSAAFLVDGLEQNSFSRSGDRSRSPSSSSCSTTSSLHQQCNPLSRQSKALSPERQSREKRCEVTSIPNRHGSERSCSSGLSSNVSTEILDRYIDGEQHLERSRLANSASQITYKGNANGNSDGRLPPRVHYAAPTSPMDSIRSKPKSHSFREGKGTSLRLSSRDWMESGVGHESPRSLAKNVVNRLAQTHVLPRSSSKDVDQDLPITIEDMCRGSISRCSDSNSDLVVEKSYTLDDPHDTANNGYKNYELLGLQKQNVFYGVCCGGLNSVKTEVDDDELRSMSKEAEDRVNILSKELERETFLHDTGFDMPALVQTIRSLTEEKMNLTLEVSGLLQSRIAERASAKEKLKLAKAELESRMRRLQREKIELHSGLEKELDRRSNDWSLKLEKYQMEEQRLRGRVRELAEQNVSLQREISTSNERETDSRNVITYYEQQVRDLTTRVEEYREENGDLRQKVSNLEDTLRAAEANLDCIKTNFGEKERECKDLQKSITRLIRTCSEQEKTIAGLRDGFGNEIEKNQELEKFDKHVAMLQREQMRLTGIELSLRREVESYKFEVDSLRHENINLLNRIKGNGKESAGLTIKLDKELWTRICCLQNQGVPMLTESTQLCSQLLEFIKGKAGQPSGAKQGADLIKNGLDGQFIVDSDMKVQGFKRQTESLIRSLQTMSALLHEKSSMVASRSQSLDTDANISGKLNDHSMGEIMRTELKAETLLTSLLREKLYSKDLEVEQLQAELATAVRGNDILRCEIQYALDNLSCVTHKLKDLELQMLKKDEKINQLQADLQGSVEELKLVKGVLPKVSAERDMMWEDVKQYSEKNMLLNMELDVLKKKIEALDEDILLKEGQITILKDAIGNKPFDLLGSPDNMGEFLRS